MDVSEHERRVLALAKIAGKAFQLAMVGVLPQKAKRKKPKKRRGARIAETERGIRLYEESRKLLREHPKIFKKKDAAPNFHALALRLIRSWSSVMKGMDPMPRVPSDAKRLASTLKGVFQFKAGSPRGSSV